MKLPTLSIILSSLLLAANAAPTDPEPRDTSPEALGLAKRSVSCKIINVSKYANCRSGPGTNYEVRHRAPVGQSYNFVCYKKGECYQGNCTWDKIIIDSGYVCYVNGYFTDSKCSMAALGKC
ncbi:uncharacterized protein BDW47DRAFT_100280 [Aspergillus candidus]|uniref:Uncharacterized protein n=1 Tax=Aspergillus candidus TaxID=41067 RepID=A0A2I2FK15_ASPCN|nr:hypothetical protein BDW47DRAFT_100280 [Aspergillus candidus]PLB40977.1 hypothetical protein BDW47DRAFT_100280 [Aspergillus candidus]